MKSRLLVLTFTLLSLFLVVVPSFAQTTSITLTEDRINQAFRVTNPPRITVSNVRVDLQPGQAVISLTLTPRRGNQTPVSGVVALVPTLSNGQVNWSVASASANGTPASGDTLAILNSIATGWASYFRAQARDSVTNITISDTDITYTLATGGTVNPDVTVGTGGTSISLSEADINSNLAIRGVTQMSVDCQPNQVVLNGSYTVRGTAYNLQAVLSPSVANGRVTWTLVSFTANGAPAPAQVSDRAQGAIVSAWQSFWSSRQGRATVTSITVNDSAITWTVQS